MDPSADISLLPAIPFALLLLSIAALPILAHDWWEKNRNRGLVAGGLALPVAIWCLTTDRGAALIHAAHEYEQFVVLLGALYVVSGGIFVGGDFRGNPRVNTAFLAVGTVLASAIGTTGAAMVLVRPLLRANAGRRRVAHTVVFFILTVCNCGGLLTPLGDPPLFLGYLRGVPFTWTMHLWPYWLGVNAALLAAYFVWDTIAFRSESPAAAPDRPEPMRIVGLQNVALLAVVVASVALITENGFVRDAILVACALASLFAVRQEPRVLNRFTWGPITEVAVLFAGIFVTMIPALGYLDAHGTSLGVATPRQFFWVTGGLSALLDNAPTYLTFTSVAASHLNEVHASPHATAEDLRTVLAATGGPALLAAISLGAVFMGALSYIGNGPNFMVKAVAESSGVKMPGFFRYIALAAAVMAPILFVVSMFLG